MSGHSFHSLQFAKTNTNNWYLKKSFFLNISPFCRSFLGISEYWWIVILHKGTLFYFQRWTRDDNWITGIWILYTFKENKSTSFRHWVVFLYFTNDDNKWFWDSILWLTESWPRLLWGCKPVIKHISYQIYGARVII